MAATDVSRPRVDDEPVSGERMVGEFRCCACGYGIVSRGVLPVCPMCRGSIWEASSWRPFTRRGP